MTLEPEPGLTWRKSSFSDGGDGACVEVAWRKSSFSGGGEGACVEVAWPELLVAVRDSKRPNDPILSLPRATWGAFTASVRA